MKAITLLALLSVSAYAGVISGIAGVSLPKFSTGSLGPVGATPSPNNDDSIGLSPNTLSQTVFLNSFGVIEASFRVTDSGGVTEYRFTPVIFNIAGPRIASMRFELGFGNGSEFVLSSEGDGLDFDSPDRNPAAVSPAFPLAKLNEDSMVFSGAIPGLVTPMPFVLLIDVPDGISGFTIRATPTAVPEPASWAMAGCAVALIAWLRRS
jgi:hypothetical protein